MANNVGRFVISIASNSRDLVQDLSKGTDSVDDFGEAWSRVGDIIVGVGSAIAAFVVSDKLLDQLQRLNDLADFSEVAGDSILNIQGLELAAGRIGIDEDAVRGTVLDFNERLGEQLQLGTGPLIDVLKVLDLEANDLFSQAPVERLLTFGDAIDKVGDQSKQLLLLRELTGDADQFIRLFQNGGDDVREAIEFIDRNGFGFDAADIRQIRAAREEWATLNFVLGNVTTRIGVALAPLGGRLARFLTDNSDSIVRLTTVIIDFAEGAVDAVDFLVTTLDNLDPALQRNIVRLAGFTGGFLAFVTVAPRVVAAIRSIYQSIRLLTRATIAANTVSGVGILKTLAGITAGIAAANFLEEKLFGDITEDFEALATGAERSSQAIGNLDARTQAFLSRFSTQTPFERFVTDLTELETLNAFGSLSNDEYVRASGIISDNYEKALANVLKIQNLLRNPAIIRNEGSVEFKLTEQGRIRGQQILRDRLARDRNEVLNSIRTLLEEIRDQRNKAEQQGAGGQNITITEVDFPPIS